MAWEKETAIWLEKAKAYCAYQERCQYEVKKKLEKEEVPQHIIDEIIAQLVAEGFINEERFAKLYAVSKFRQKQWGKIKIKQGLRQKQISTYSIQKALNNIDEEEYVLTIKKLIEKKENELKLTNKQQRFSKILNYAIGKGFESEKVYNLLQNQQFD